MSKEGNYYQLLKIKKNKNIWSKTLSMFNVKNQKKQPII